MVGSVVLDIVYGYEAQPKGDKWTALSDGIVNDMGAAARQGGFFTFLVFMAKLFYRPGAWLVDVVPAC